MSRSSVAKGFISELDGLRGVAILLVMVHRFWPRTAVGVAADAAGAGWIGVDLFFVISGFLITGILLDTRGEPGYFRNFYARRALRIFPLYYLFVIGVLLAFSGNPEFMDHSGSPFWYVTHLGNVPEGLLDHDVPYWLAPVWSLAIEEQFYLTFPWLVYLLDRRKLTILLIAMVVSAPLIRLATMLAIPDQERIQYLFTLCRIDTIAAGCLLAVAARTIDLERWRGRAVQLASAAVAIAVIVGVVTGLDRTTSFGRALGYSSVSLGVQDRVRPQESGPSHWIVELVAQAQRSRAPIQKLADHVAGWFVPIVIAIAAASFAMWAAFGPEPRLAHALINAIAVVIIACPCALGLATPISIMVAVGRGAQIGVLFRDAQAVERLEKVDTLFVDKTGTLTEGRPAVTDVFAVDGNELAVLRAAAAVERGSEHPLAQAIVHGAEARKITIPASSQFESVTGKGVTGTVEGQRVLLGNRALIADAGIDLAMLNDRADALRAEGKTAMFVAIDGRAAGIVVVADPIKASTHDALRALRDAGMRVVMVTGDSRRTAEAVAKKVGIEQVIAEVMPADKVRVVDEAQREGRIVAMAGDGINDAPALAKADVGIAMGTGTDIAIESAGVTLVKGDLRSIARAVTLSRATMWNIKPNLFFAFVYNAAGIPLAAGVLYPFTGWLLSPMIAALAMSLSSVSVIGNALRLRRTSI